MTKLNVNFTISQLKRLKYSVDNKNIIPKDIRKKLYLRVKVVLKTSDGIVDTLMTELHKFAPHDYDVMVCIPSDEISLKSYWDFIGEEPDSDYDENKLFTFNCNDDRLEGTGLACLQQYALHVVLDDVVEYDTDLYLKDNIFVDARMNIIDIVEQHSNQTSR